MDRNGKITIIEVAQKAGVSKGTVDRVVHNRGEVSKESAEKVRKAIEELNYQPNLYASILGSRKDRIIACLLPRFSEGDYWEKLYRGFLAGGEAVAALNIRTQVFLYDEFDHRSFSTACEEMLASGPSGVILQPLFKNDTALLASRLKEMGIPYILVDSKLEESDYLAYYGMHMYNSGKLCAFLLTERLEEAEIKDVAVIRIRRDKGKLADPTLDRRAGFIDYMNERFPSCRIHHIFIEPNAPEETFATLEAFFTSHPGAKLLVMFNSRIHLLAEYLKNNPMEGRRVIGYDNLDKNVEALKNGLVSILISEHIEEQTKQAVTTLADNILMFKRPAVRDNYMHMDVLTRMNIDYY